MLQYNTGGIYTDKNTQQCHMLYGKHEAQVI